jgi:hypothetical protein
MNFVSSHRNHENRRYEGSLIRIPRGAWNSPGDETRKFRGSSGPYERMTHQIVRPNRQVLRVMAGQSRMFRYFLVTGPPRGRSSQGIAKVSAINELTLFNPIFSGKPVS